MTRKLSALLLAPLLALSAAASAQTMNKGFAINRYEPTPAGEFVLG